jgi:CheY-like chemotaxis protein
VQIEGSPVWIVPELAQSLALILHELATNAVKHGALSNTTGRVKVCWSRIEGGAPGRLRIVWQEEGGPTVSEPTGKGFGLTVLQEAAGDVGGVATCDFRSSGLVYTLEGPFEMQQSAPAPAFVPERREASATREPVQPAKGEGRRILVVEDEALVALQLQEDLESDGHHVVGPARCLEQGISLALSEDIDAALVDVSLGRDTSTPIADQLIARNIPFAFATGYADGTMLPEHLRKVPRLSKPYALADVRRLVESLISQDKRPQERKVRAS